ncbi:hypothetical protein HPP92_003554 [Vanilla planifolia]|uniref:BURP domain-containing protein n=1 Tax=Vanilla planifolia TaxID=51239 RepID=A0A835VLL2_VANPL|nr:hypothetical protein HPP92_003554 [Vanilla planifolia]
MDSLLPLFLSLFLCAAVGADLPAKAYWRTILPHTPMPSVIEQLLQPESYVEEKGATDVNVGKGGVNVNTGKGTSVNVGHGGVGVNVKPKGKPVIVNVKPKGSPFSYLYAAADTQLLDDPSAALFFLREDLRPGKEMTVGFTTTPGLAASFLPRSTADAIPFSSHGLPLARTRLGVAPGTEKAEAMQRTVEECEEPAAEGEKKLCVTSVEGMVDFATGSLGTRKVVAMATEGGDGVLRTYSVLAARKVASAGGKGVVSCHAEEYAYAVFLCHGTRTAEVYEVEMAAVDGSAKKVNAVAVCHVNTGAWNPKYLAFKVLGVKPGTVPVCHFLPRDHVVWAARG